MKLPERVVNPGGEHNNVTGDKGTQYYTNSRTVE